ncbi:MAG: ribonuclease P protein component [Bdellovibrionales bacterium]
MLALVKNKKTKTLKTKKDFQSLKQAGKAFSYQWMRIIYSKEPDKNGAIAWAFPKKYVSRAVDRNQMKRWGRELVKKSNLTQGLLLVTLLRRDKEFYKKLKREEFKSVFKSVLEKISKKSQ